MADMVEVECPHCEVVMVLEYEVDYDETPPANAYQSGHGYYFLAMLDLPDECPDGCELSKKDKEALHEKTEKYLLRTGD